MEQTIPDEFPKDRRFEVHYDYGRSTPLGKIVGSYFRKTAMERPEAKTQCYFPVITEVEHLTANQVRIKRAMIYQDYYNERPYPTETIIISREAFEKDDLVLNSYCNFRHKQELTKIYAIGWLIKQQLLDYDAHPAFKRNPQLLANLFMYKSLRELNLMRHVIGIKKEPKSDLKSFADLTFSDVLELI